MDKQPPFGINRPPNVLAWNILEETQRLSFRVSEQEEAKAIVETPLQPLHFGLKPRVLPVCEAADPAVAKVRGAHLVQQYLVSRNQRVVVCHLDSLQWLTLGQCIAGRSFASGVSRRKR
jgi:hypothetical protein